MTVKEAKEIIEELKKNGNTEEELVSAFYGMFTEDKITVDELQMFVSLLGYELSEEFLNMSPEDQKTKGWEDEDEDNEEDIPPYVQEYLDMIETLRKQGLVDEEILEGFYRMYEAKKITIDELGDLVQLLGYELSDDFKKRFK